MFVGLASVNSSEHTSGWGGLGGNDCVEYIDFGGMKLFEGAAQPNRLPNLRNNARC
jgi:hypothetical protein